MLLLKNLMLAGEVLELLPLSLDVSHGALKEDRLGAALERGGKCLAETLESITQLVPAALASARFSETRADSPVRSECERSLYHGGPP